MNKNIIWFCCFIAIFAICIYAFTKPEKIKNENPIDTNRIDTIVIDSICNDINIKIDSLKKSAKE